MACASTAAPTTAARRSASWPPISPSRWSARTSRGRCALRRGSSGSRSGLPPRKVVAAVPRRRRAQDRRRSPRLQARRDERPRRRRRRRPSCRSTAVAGAGADQRSAPANRLRARRAALDDDQRIVRRQPLALQRGLVGLRQHRRLVGVGEDQRGAGRPAEKILRAHRAQRRRRGGIDADRPARAARRISFARAARGAADAGSV